VYGPRTGRDKDLSGEEPALFLLPPGLWDDGLEVHIFAIREISKMCGLGICRNEHLQVEFLKRNSTGRCTNFAF
jgi:hypothetical protein